MYKADTHMVNGLWMDGSTLVLTPKMIYTPGGGGGGGGGGYSDLMCLLF